MKYFAKNIQLLHTFIGFSPYQCGRFVFANTKSGSSGSGPESKDEEKKKHATELNAESPEKSEAPEKVAPSVKIGESIDVVRSSVAENIGEAIGNASEAIKAAQSRENKELADNITKIREELRNMRGVAEESQKKLREKINQLLDQKKISAEQAKELLNLGGSLPDFEERLKKITDPLQSKLDPEELKNLIDEKKKEAEQFPKIREEFERITQKLATELEKSQHFIYQEAYKERALKEQGRQLGFELKPGTVLRFRYKRPVLKPVKDDKGNVMKDEKGNVRYEQEKDAKGELKYEPIFRRATIKEVKFGQFEMKRDGQTKTFPSLTPSVVLDIEDEWPDQNGIINKNSPEIGADRLKEVVDMQDVTVAYEEKSTLEEELDSVGKILGVEIKPGAVFSYRDISLGDDGAKGSDKQVSIVNILREKDNFFDGSDSPQKDREQTMIELDHEVVTKHHPVQQKSSRLSLGEFIKWATRLSAVPLLALGLNELRKKLQEDNVERNEKYKRNPKEYPPIELKKDEILCYDTVPPTLFRIKDITDDKITLDNGSEYTPASFFKWVKDNDVEKFSPDAEAEKRVAMMEEDTDEQKEEKEKTRDKAKEEAKIAEAVRKNPPPGYSTETSEKPTPPSVGYLRSLYNQTYFLSLGSFYEIGKQIFEYIKRYMDRAEKERIGIIGNKALGFIPQLGREFEVIRQNAETEQVNYYKGAFDQYGYGDFINRLVSTNNRDELKALIIVMSEKGYLNWRDKTLWAAITRIASQYDFDLSQAEHNEDNIREILDKFWGPGSFNDFRNKNDSTYQNRVNEHKQWALRLENDPEQRGGMAGRLKGFLHAHLNGEWVDPAVYEAILYTAIENGKLSFGEKIYFLIMGFGMEGKKGTKNEGSAILDWYRLSQIEGTLLNKYPILDYFTGYNISKVDSQGKPIWDPSTGTQKKAQIGINELRKIIHTVIEPDTGKSIDSISEAKEFKPGARLQNMIESEMILDPTVVTRLKDKAARDFENWDHDDFHIFGPQIKERQIENLAQKSGAKQNASMAAIKNTFAGLNHFTQRYLDQYIETAKSGDDNTAQENISRMTETIKSLIRLDAVVDNRFHHDKHDHVKFSGADYKSYAGADARKSRTIRGSNNEVYTFVETLIKEMKGYVPNRQLQELSNTWTVMLAKVASASPQKQREQIDAHNGFGLKFESALAIMQEKVGNRGLAEIFDKIQNGTVPGNKLIKGIQEQAQSKAEMQESTVSQKETFGFDIIRGADLGDLAGEYRRLNNQLEEEGKKPDAAKKAEKSAKVENIVKMIEQKKYDKVNMDEEKILKKAIDETRRALGLPPEYSEKKEDTMM